jgi:hypothetical protein
MLCPNQHIGAWKVGFMPQWIVREYIARRGSANFRPNQLTPARCPLLGHTLSSMLVEGTQIPPWLLEVNLQREVSEETYDKGGEILADFFRRELSPYLEETDLDPLGKDIITCCLDGGTLEQYTTFLS